MTREERWLEIIKEISGGQRERKWSGVVRSRRDGKRWSEMVKSQSGGEDSWAMGVRRGHQTEGKQPGILEMITETEKRGSQ